LTLETLAERVEGLLCLSGCRQGVVASALLVKDEEGARRMGASSTDESTPNELVLICHQKSPRLPK
jgi:hypothetical protein